jgi:nucleoside-diphosphate-sugar epimerase
MRILFIGGTGIISSACARAAIDRGYDVTLLTRGRSQRPIPEGAHSLQGDIYQEETANALLDNQSFDVVVNWIVFSPDQLEADMVRFRGRVGQYVFISSASAYQTPPTRLPITESTPLSNPFWAYSRAKIACEDRLVRAYRESGFPATIVRPSHTYDRTLLPMRGGWTVVERMRRGQPVIVHGDGTSLWTLTHHVDFARGFTGLLGHPAAIGEAFHITADEALTWNQIYRLVGQAAGTEPELVHVPSDLIAAFDPDWGASLLGDKTHSMVFDNSKIKSLVPDFQATTPFWQGAQEILGWHLADPSRQQIDAVFNNQIDSILAAYRTSWPTGS